MKTIIVTGGAGFIGSNLCKRLLGMSYKVICVDNFYSGNKKNIEGLLQNPNFLFYNHDVTESFTFDVDEIYHLACPASPVAYQRDPIFTFETNILGTRNVLDLSLKNQSKVLLSSTSEVYGDPEHFPQNESYWGNVNPIGLRSCYDEGKRGAECLFFDYHRKRKARIKVARIFNCYGPNMAIDDGRVISNFIVSALKDAPISVYGDGLQTRSFCYVDDLVTGLISLMESGDRILGPINLGNPQEISIIDTANIIIKLTNSKSIITFSQLPSDDPRRRKPDITLAKNILKWEPKIMLEEGLKKTIEYFKGVV